MNIHGISKPGSVDPTPEQIREECAKIQATWTPYEEQRHAVIKRVQWEPPQLHKRAVSDNEFLR